jgi:dihydroxyacetone kinase-like predicted kinase
VLVVGDEATLKVHVHTDDPEAAKALFAGVGEIEREDIADMIEQIAARTARLAAARTGVVVVASGKGMGRLFEEELGAVVVDGGPTLNPSTNDILDGIGRVASSEVLVLPNSKDVLLAAEEAARLSERDVVVLPSESQQGALAALVELDPDAGAKENARRLETLLGEIRVGSVATAVKDDVEGRFAAGECVGFAGEDVVAWGDPEPTLAKTLEYVADGAELVTVIEGEDAGIPLGEIGRLVPDGIELETHVGGQRHYRWLIAAQ